MTIRSLVCVLVASFLVNNVPQANAQETEAATRQFASAVGFQNQKLFDDAIVEWKTFLKKFPTDARAGKAQHYLGTCCLQEKRYPEAISAFNVVVSKYPRLDLLDQSTLNLGIAWYGQAQKSSKDSDYANAEQAFAKMLTGFPSSSYVARALYYRGECLFQLEKPQQAAEVYAEFVRRFPKDDLHADAMYGLGTALESIKAGDKAEAAFAAFVSAYPQHPLVTEVRMRQADLLFTSGDFAKAKPVFEAISKDKDFELADVAMLRHARCLYEAGDLEASARLYWNVPREFKDTKHYDAAILAGAKCFYLKEMYPTARSGLEKLIDRNAAESAEATQWLARCFLKEGQPDKALRIVDKGLRKIKVKAVRTELELARIDAMYEIPSQRKQTPALYVEFANRHRQHELAPQSQYMAALSSVDLKDYNTAKRNADLFLTRFRDSDLTPDVLFISAESELLLGNHEQAASRYQTFLTKAPKHANSDQAKVRLGLALFMADKPADAARLLNPVVGGLRDKKLKAEAYSILGRSYAAEKRYDSATAMLQKAIAEEPDVTRRQEAQIALAEAFRELGRDAEADNQLKTMLRTSTKGEFAAEASFRLAEAAYADEKLQDAVRYYSAVVKTAPKSEFAPHALYGQGWTLFNLGEFEDCSATMTKLISDYRREKIAAKGMYVRAMAAYQLEQYSSVLRDVDGYLKSRPELNDELDALYVKGLALGGLSELEKAAVVYRDILARSRNYKAADKVAYELGWTFMELKDTDAAVTTFGKLASNWPESPLAAEGLFLVGEAYYDAEKFKQAADAYSASSDKAKSKEIAEKSFHKLGWSQLKLENTSAARAAFNQQLAKFPDGELASDANFLIGECCFKNEDWAVARQAFEAVAADSNSSYVALAMFRAGESAASMEDWRSSGRWHQKVLAGYPDFDMLPEARYGYAWALQNEGQIEQAIPIFEQVTEETQSETAAKARFMIGECLFAQKKHKEATRNFLKAAFTYNHQEWSAMAYFEAARCFEVLRDVEQASTCYQNLISKYPQHSKVKDARRRLADLQ